MLDDNQLEYAVRELIIDLCEVLHRNGYETVPVGAMMRLVGVSNEQAAKHDTEYFALDQDFSTIIKSRKVMSSDESSGVVLH